jgi:hypothetical protein
MRVEFVVFDAATIGAREAQLARVAVEQCLSQLGQQASAPLTNDVESPKSRSDLSRQPA